MPEQRVLCGGGLCHAWAARILAGQPVLCLGRSKCRHGFLYIAEERNGIFLSGNI